MQLNESDALKLSELIPPDLPAPEKQSLAILLTSISPSSCEVLSEQDTDDFRKVVVFFSNYS